MKEKIKLLYVDDEPINLQLFQLNLRKKYDVLVAENGMKGLDILSINKDVAVVISDMKMPKMNGIEFIKAAKEKYPELSYFILTGYEITNEIRNALNSGLIFQYFRKPVDLIEVDRAIKKVII